MHNSDGLFVRERTATSSKFGWRTNRCYTIKMAPTGTNVDLLPTVPTIVVHNHSAKIWQVLTRVSCMGNRLSNKNQHWISTIGKFLYKIKTQLTDPSETELSAFSCSFFYYCASALYTFTYVTTRQRKYHSSWHHWTNDYAGFLSRDPRNSEFSRIWTELAEYCRFFLGLIKINKFIPFFTIL